MVTTIELGPGGQRQRRPISAGPDRLTVVLLALAAFLVVLALLAAQLRTAPPAHVPRIAVLRRIYVTRVVETVVGATRGSSVTQSTSTTGSVGPAAAATTRSSY
jgi:hypothetical protein